MTRVLLRLRSPPTLRVDMRDVDAIALCALGPDSIARSRVWHANEHVELGSLFEVRVEATSVDAPELVVEGDLGRFDRLGWGQTAGRFVIDGHAGDYAGARMEGGELVVQGDVGDHAACGLSGGALSVGGNCGDFVAAAFPGDMEGMRGGTVVVGGSAGARAGDRMRRGDLIVHGSVGDFAGSRMVAGTIAVGAGAGSNLGHAMRRGTIVLASAPFEPAPTFASVAGDFRVFWRLLAKHLERFGGAFAGVAGQVPARYAGDAAVAGIGEVIRLNPSG